MSGGEPRLVIGGDSSSCGLVAAVYEKLHKCAGGESQNFEGMKPKSEPRHLSR
jgi:hypothetical protein